MHEFFDKLGAAAKRAAGNVANEVSVAAEKQKLSDAYKDLGKRYYKAVKIGETAALAAEALIRELHAEGFEDIRITSGYRSYEYQQILFNTYLGNEMKKHPDWTVEQCRAEVLTYSALPGESEHQTGLCMDLISTKNVVLDETFADNPAYAWLTENAHNFGFILRYPEGKEEYYGTDCTAGHFRYVGVDAAKYITENNLCLEEFLLLYDEDIIHVPGIN